MTQDQPISNYQICKLGGHSVAKAAQIVLDIKRGNTWAIAWVNMLREEHAHVQAHNARRGLHAGPAMPYYAPEGFPLPIHAGWHRTPVERALAALRRLLPLILRGPHG